MKKNNPKEINKGNVDDFLIRINVDIKDKAKELATNQKNNDNVTYLHSMEKVETAKDIFSCINLTIGDKEQQLLRLFINTLTLDSTHLYNSGFYMNKISTFPRQIKSTKARLSKIVEVFYLILNEHFQELEEVGFVFDTLYTVAPVNKTHDYSIKLDYDKLNNALKDENSNYNVRIVLKQKETFCKIIFEKNYSSNDFTAVQVNNDVIKALNL